MISQELLQGFIVETSDLLDDIEPALVSYSKIEDEKEREEVVNRVFRHFHSIKGSAGFVGLHNIAKLTHEAETLLEAFRIRPGRVLPESAIALLCRTVDFLRMMLANQGKTDSQGDGGEGCEQLIRDIAATGKSLKNPGDAGMSGYRHDTTIQISPLAGKRLVGGGQLDAGAAGSVKKTAKARLMEPDSDIPDEKASATQFIAKPATQRKLKATPRPSSTSSRQKTDASVGKRTDTVRIIKANAQGSVEMMTRGEFLGRYVAEANELLEQTEQVLLRVEQDPESGNETVQEALRCLHSFKGNSGFMNLDDLERLSHRMEAEIEIAIGRSTGLDAQTIDVLLQMIDVLRQGVLDLSYGGSGGIPEADVYIAMMDEAHHASAYHRTAVRAAAPREEKSVWDDFPAERLKRAAGDDAALALPPDSPGQPAGETPGSERGPGLAPLGTASAQEDLSGGIRVARIDMSDESASRPSGPPPDPAAESQAKSKTLRRTGQASPERPGSMAPARNPSAQKAAVATARNDIRVDLNKLDLMLDLVGELVIAETMVTRHPAVVGQENESLERAVHQLRRVANSLQDMAMSVRMIPLVSTFRRMIRLVYDLSMKAGKLVDLSLIGEETEVDRTVIELISDPLVHIIRNAIDHGIEAPAERRALDKPETGRVTIEGRHEGGEVWIVITDDGRGLNRDLIVKKAIERGLLSGDGSDLTDNQAYHFIFEPGFSTAAQVTDISGRGFGMDVVKKNIEKLSGRIDIRTREGEGTAVIMRIPLTLAIIDGMLVRAGDTRYIIPLLSIRESLKPDPEQIAYTPDGQALVKLRQSLIPVVKLDEVFSRVKLTKNLDEGILMVVEGEDGGTVALFADELLGQQETVIKGLTGWLKKSRGVSGCTILGDGEVGLILDIGAIVKLAGGPGAA